MVAPTARKPAGIHPYAGRDVPWLLQTQAYVRGDATFLIWEPFDGESRRWSFAAFASQVERVAANLHARGVRQADAVLIHSDNCPEFLLAWFACARLGAIAVTTNTRSSVDELRYFIDHSRVKAAVTQTALLSLVSECGPDLEWIACIGGCDQADKLFNFEALFAAAAPTAPDRARDPTLPISVQYTSGTTSRPKGVVWTHANALWAAQTNARHCELTAADVAMVVLPLFHTNAMGYSTLGSLWAGGAIVLAPRFSASRFWATSIRNGCTWASLVPFVAAALREQETPPHNYRFWAIGASDPPSLPEKFGVKFVGWWGMTETVSHGIVDLHHMPGKPGSMGYVAPEYEIDVRDEESGASIAVTEGVAAGRLYVRGVVGVSLFLQYLHDPEATAAAFDADGWMDTGDIVVLHADGNLSFSDRAKDMLKVGGENVAASEIERVIIGLEDVSEAAVVGKPHPLLNEVPVAFVVPVRRSEGLERKVMDHCASLLADFKRPVDVIVVDDLPRSLLNKVAKRELRARLEKEGV